MVFFYPKNGARNQKAANLRLSVIENHCPPFLMLTLAGVCVFIAGRAVKAVKPEAVTREMRGNPVKNYAYSVFMHNIDEFFKIIGCAVARGRGEISRDLVSP